MATVKILSGDFPMVDHDDESIKAAIVAAQRKRELLVDEIKKIQDQLSRLDSFISQGWSIIGKEPEKAEVPKPETKIEKAIQVLTGKTNRDKIEEVIRESGHSMKIPDIVDEFDSKRWSLGKNRRVSLQIVRNNLLKYEDIFIQLDDKSWDLRNRGNPEKPITDPPRLFRDTSNAVQG
jgi:hypothetical protein